MKDAEGGPEVVPHESTHRFNVPLERLWEAIDEVQRYPELWSWLRNFEANDDRLRAGLVMRGRVVPPVPYSMRVTVELTDVTPMHEVTASVRGDLVGLAALSLRAAGDGSELTVCWTVEMCRPAMRLAARVARPMLIRGHDHVVDATARRLRRHLQRPGRTR